MDNRFAVRNQAYHSDSLKSMHHYNNTTYNQVNYQIHSHNKKTFCAS